MPAAYSFPKRQRLCGEIRIARLFAEGRAFIEYPLRVVYLQDEKQPDAALRVLISAPKKRFKRAVHRNLLKRRMREVFRQNRHELESAVNPQNYTVNIAFNYVANEILPYSLIEKKMQKALAQITEQLIANENNERNEENKNNILSSE